MKRLIIILIYIISGFLSLYPDDFVEVKGARRVIGISGVAWGLFPSFSNERYIYPGQEKLEKSLSDAIPDRRQFAALLPLKMSLEQISEGANAKLSDHYILSLLMTITEEKWADALPLIENGLRAGLFEMQRRDQAAGVWVWLKMEEKADDEEKIIFLMDLIEGKQNFIKGEFRSISLYLVDLLKKLRVSLKIELPA